MSGRSALAISVALAAATPAGAHELAPDPATATPIAIGMTHLVEFAPGDRREVNVYLPDGYDDEAAFPVLYLVDGGLDQDFLHVAGTTALNAIWGRSQPVILVGIRHEIAVPS